MVPRSPASCPSENELLHWICGSLSGRRAAKVQAHLRTCQTCSDRVSEWNETVERSRKDTSQEDAHEQPRRLRNFRAALAAEDERRQRSSRRRWSSAAALAATLLMSVVWYTQTEVTLDAATVIARTIEHESRYPQSGHTAIRLRRPGTALTAATQDGSVNPHRGIDQTATESELVSNDAPAARELGQRLARYGFDLRAPLSARHFQRWRTDTAARDDRLQLLSDGLLKVSATTTEGPVGRAEIVVRQESYEPVAQSWYFNDGFEVEVTRLADGPRAAPTRIASAEPTDDKPRPSVNVASRNLDVVELDLRRALHGLRAPVGRGLSVRSTQNLVRVEGAVATPELLEQIAAYAKQESGLDVHLRVRPASMPSSAGASMPGLQAWLDEAFSEPAAALTFARRVWELNEGMRDAVASLTELGERYPATSASTMPTDSQRKIQQLAEGQYRQIVELYEMTERQLAPLTGTVRRPTLPQQLPDDWRVRATPITEALERFSAGIRTIFGEPVADTAVDFTEASRQTLRPSLQALAEAAAGTSTTPN